MHARKRFYFLTQNTKIPALINELQSDYQVINEAHPALAAINAVVAQKKANVEVTVHLPHLEICNKLWITRQYE
jgi:hypothetical protein